MNLEYLKKNKEIFNEFLHGLNYETDYGVNVEWLLVSNHEESLEYHKKHFSFLPDEIIEKLSEVNFKRKVFWELETKLNKLKI